MRPWNLTVNVNQYQEDGMSPRLPTDFSEAKEYGPLPVEENPYQCEVTDIGEVQTSDKGTKYVNVEFTVVGGEHQDRKVWRNCPITGEGAGIYLDFVRKAMGDVDMEPEEVAEVPTEDLVGRPIDVIITHEEYPEDSGIMRNRIQRLLVAE